MKQLKFILMTLIAVISFTACEDDDFEFVATTPPEGAFAFTSTFLPEYVLPAENTTDGNIGATFTFNVADFGVPTSIGYELQSSVLGDFTDATTVSPTLAIENNTFSLTIRELKTLATDTYLWEAPTQGVMNFRVRAFPGDATSTTEAFSDVAMLNVSLLEAANTGGSGIEPSPWGIVGSGYNDWGNAGPDGQFYTTMDPDILVAYVALVDGQIKFRTNNDWSSGDDLGDANNDGILDREPDNNINVTAGDYRITFNTDDNSYSIEEWSWGVVGSGFNDWGNAGPDGKFYYDYTTDTFKASLMLVDGQIKFRTNNDWSSGDDLGDAGNDGILDRDPDNNIDVTAGHYLITLNFNDNSYSIVEDDVWGIVGSAFNDWGNAGPDFALTEVQPDILVGDIATLINGELKFRSNNDWSSGDDLGDANDDDVLDRDDDNNISVDAGLYRVRVNLMDNSYALYKIQ